jgi:hypothetical protein
MRFRAVNIIEESVISCGFVASRGVFVECWMGFEPFR